MVTELGVAYVAGVTILFFFWAYGIYAFARDLRSRYVPGARRYLRGRRRQNDESEREEERERRKRQLE